MNMNGGSTELHAYIICYLAKEEHVLLKDRSVALTSMMGLKSNSQESPQ